MLSIVIPARNAEGIIARTLEDYHAFFSGVRGQDFEIVVVPNECTDNTLGIVQDYCDRYPVVRCKVFEESIGKGGAILEGFKAASGDVLAFVDADGSTTPEELNRLLGEMGQHDVVVGSRWLPGSRILIRQPLVRRVASRGFNLLIRQLFGLPFRDTQCGAKIFTRRAVDAVAGRVGTGKFAFDVELLYRLRSKGFDIIEVPTVWENKPGSTLHLQSVVPEMLRAVLKVRLQQSPLRHLVPGRARGGGTAR